MSLKSARKTKILYTTADADPQSGAYRSLLYMSREVRKRGFESVLALPRGNNQFKLLLEDELETTYTLRLPRPRLHQPLSYYLKYFFYNAQSVLTYVDIIRKESIALVHINEVLDLAAAVAARIARVPCVCHVRAVLPFPSIVRQGFPRLAVFLANAVISVSCSVYYDLFVQQGIKTNKVVVIHNPAPDPTLFNPDICGESIRTEFGIAQDTFLVTLVGKFEEWKGHDVFVRAIPQVLALFPNTRFMIVGGELDGPLHAKYAGRLKSLPRELGVGGKVIFTGYRSDIPQIMAASDVVPFCSTDLDPFPGVVLQAMAVGRPIIASNIGGPREQIEDGISGLFVEPDNPTALAEKICYLLQNENERKRLGDAAAKRVTSVFNADVFLDSLSNLYKKLLY